MFWVSFWGDDSLSIYVILRSIVYVIIVFVELLLFLSFSSFSSTSAAFIGSMLMNLSRVEVLVLLGGAGVAPFTSVSLIKLARRLGLGG